MRNSGIFFFFILACLSILAVLAMHARHARAGASAVLAANVGLVKTLGLTDLCLFTEARYTRHPSMADLHSPFQDHPFAMDHFPSGSLVTPPRLLQRAP
ncbi:MAG TPA: hypothetical protein VMJ66_15085 [Geobacteraceae bacterium]|nr:hypothetical protein [Geobacteraceae bacterium]